MIRTLLSVALCGLLVPGEGKGQQPDPGRDGVSAVASPAVKLSPINGSATFLLGGDLTLHFTPTISVGGGGFRLARRIDARHRDEREDIRLGFGYGGVVIGYREPRDTDPATERSLGGTILLGAGNARVFSTAVDAEIGTQNVLVVEPSLTLDFHLHPSIDLGVQAGYRWVSSVESLPGISTGGLRGISTAVSLRFVRSP